MANQGVVYFIELSRPLGNDVHQAHTYIGYADDGDWQRRLQEHREGAGSKMLAYAASVGIDFNVVAVVQGSGRLERGFKNRGSGRRTLAQLRAGKFPATVTYTSRKGVKEVIPVPEFEFVH